MITEQLRTTNGVNPMRVERPVLPALNGTLTPNEPINIVSNNDNGLTLPKKEPQPEKSLVTLINGQEISGITDTTRKILIMILDGKSKEEPVRSEHLMNLFPKIVSHVTKLDNVENSIETLGELLKESGLIISTIEDINLSTQGHLYDLEAIIKPDDKTTGDQSSEKLFTTRYISKKFGIRIATVQDRIHEARKGNPNFGILIQIGLEGRKWYLLTKAQLESLKKGEETFKKSLPASSPTPETGLSYAKETPAKVAKMKEESRRAAQKNETKYKIKQASQLDQVAADFTNAILDSLATKPLKRLGKDLNAFLETHSPKTPRQSIEKYTDEQIGIFFLTSLIRTLNYLSQDMDEAEKDWSKSRSKVSKARLIVYKYRNKKKKDQTEEEKIASGIKNAALAVAGHFSIPVTEKQIAFTLHLFRSLNTKKV